MNSEKINEPSDNVKTPWNELSKLDPNELAKERMRETIVDMTEIGEGELRDAFPSGNYLYHGAKNEDIDKIIESGFLGNAIAFSGERGKNSGYEGISWSMDGIDALPGTDGHLAGFLAAPENVLGENTKLAIPSRPAPFEMLQISEGLKTEEFFEDRMQCEMWGDIGLAEKNSVLNNFGYIATFNQLGKDNMLELKEPMLFRFLEKQDWDADDLRKLYDDNDGVKLSKELFQQFEIPVGAVWMQYVIDSGWMKKAAGGDYGEMGDWRKKIIEKRYAEMSVREMLEQMKNGDDDLRILFQSLPGNIIKGYDERVDKELEKAEKIEVPLKKMYFITNKADVDGWIEKFAKSGYEPKGFLLYNENEVQKSNFAAQEKGDHIELTNEINRAVGANMDFWQKEMDIDVANFERSGSVGQVLKEDKIKNRNKVVQMVDGQLTVVKES